MFGRVALAGFSILVCFAACGGIAERSQGEAGGNASVSGAFGAGGARAFGGAPWSASGGNTSFAGSAALGGTTSAGAFGAGGSVAGYFGRGGASAGTAGAAARGGFSFGGTYNAGASGLGGSIAQGGVASASACDGDYVACGCGCCDAGPQTPTRCYYPETGQTLESIVASDSQFKMSPGCAQAGCSYGVHYTCCTAEGAPTPAGVGASYFTAFAPETQRLAVTLEGEFTPTCVNFSIVHTGQNPEPQLSLPAGWSWNAAGYNGCAANGQGVNGIGAMGSASFMSMGSTCYLNFDLTLFFPQGSGVFSQRLDGTALAADIAPADCR